MTRQSWLMWRWPIVISIVSATGLVSALVSDEIGDWWSWIALGLPVVVAVWKLCTPNREK